MELANVLTALGLDAGDVVAARLREALAARADTAAAPADWRTLAAAVARSLDPARESGGILWPDRDVAGPPLVLGLAGGQGTGKSTLARVLQVALELSGARTVTCSIDDFYLSRSRRRDLARRIHPLLVTRGVPGTHDVALLHRVIDGLAATGTVILPAFDKGADDLLPTNRWPSVAAPVDVLVLEGWCVGAPPQPDEALAEPVNPLEATEDADGVWRRYVNDALAGRYADLWRRLHGLIYLQVPDLDAVRRWRAEQEQALPVARRMDAAALERFIAHYERVTRAMLADLPARAPLVVRLGEDHRVVEVRCNSRI